MSPQIALHDPIFRAYFWIVLISLAIGGGTLGFLRFVLKKTPGPCLEPIGRDLHGGDCLIVVFLGRIPTIVGVYLTSRSTLSREFARASGLYRDWWITGAVYAGIGTVGILR